MDPTLERRIKALQAHLGLKKDGVLGPVTLTAIENALEITRQHHNMIVSKGGLDAIVKYEISSYAYYERHLKRPTWPKGASGVTIGVGYDLGYHSKQDITSDWGGLLDDKTIAKLLVASKKTGKAAEKLVKKMRRQSIEIEIDDAKQVFFRGHVPEFAKRTRRAFPGIQSLPGDAQAALLSLVFNRGASMKDTDSRREMRAIRKHVKRQNLSAIADEVRSMKRLWEGKGLDGLIARREKEATQIETSDRDYDPAELVYV